MPFTITITLDDNGQLSLNGPLENKVLCYGLLGLAHEALVKHTLPQSTIVRPNLVLPMTPRNGG